MMSEKTKGQILEEQIADVIRQVQKEMYYREMHRQSRGKPPWHKGRWKTRGGRDQDRWRKRHSLVKIMRERRNLRYGSIEDYCRANGIEFRRFVPDQCERASGTLTLKDNLDCDFVKGGES